MPAQAKHREARRVTGFRTPDPDSVGKFAADVRLDLAARPASDENQLEGHVTMAPGGVTCGSG